MALTVNNLVVKGKEPEISSKPASKASEERVLELAPASSNNNEAKLVVNGKVKTISKKSAFLLDMLSLDD